MEAGWPMSCFPAVSPETAAFEIVLSWQRTRLLAKSTISLPDHIRLFAQTQTFITTDGR